MLRITVGSHNGTPTILMGLPTLIIPSADGCVETFQRSHKGGRVMARNSDGIWLVIYSILVSLGLVAWAYLPA